jgi:large subunit ribosomal protein L2
VDFLYNKKDIPAKIKSIEYDPNRSAFIGLAVYKDGEKRYVILPQTVKPGDDFLVSEKAPLTPGNRLPLKNIPVGTPVHNIELTKGRGGQIARSAGNQAMIVAKEEKYVQVKMPSGEIRRILNNNYATIGQLSNIEWKDRVFRKAGTKRHMGIRPTVRGVAQDPKSHPHGGGEGRSGIGMKYPKTYTGRRAVGKTRDKKKYSNKHIVKRRKV